MYLSSYFRFGILIPFFTVLANCSGGGGESGGSVDASSDVFEVGGPEFLSFGTNTATIAEEQSVVFSAVLTDPDGIEDLVGGTLTSPDETIQYGAFATSGQAGAYSLELTWTQIAQAESLDFVEVESRSFRAIFFDSTGKRSTKTALVELTCGASNLGCEDTCIVGTNNDNCGQCGQMCNVSSGVDVCAGNEYGCIAPTTSSTPDSCDSICESAGKTCSDTCNIGSSNPVFAAGVADYGSCRRVLQSCTRVATETESCGFGEFPNLVVQSCCCL